VADARLDWLLATLRREADKRFLLICAEDDTALDIATELRGHADAVLCRWYDEGLGAFSQSCNYGNAVLQQLGTSRDTALANPGDTAAVDTLIENTRRITTDVRAQLEAGRDRLLELASTDPVESAALAQELQQIDDQPGPWPFIERAADSFGLELEELSADSYSIHIGSAAEQQDFPGLPEDGCSGTDDRDVALHREDLEFITWEHPLVRGLLHMVVDGDTGKTAAAALKAQPFKPGEVLIETVFSLQSATPGKGWERYLPTTSVRLLHTRSGLEIASKVPGNWLAMNVTNIDRGTARKLIEAQRDTLAGRMRQIETEAENRIQPIAEAARESAAALYRDELARLEDLSARGAPVRTDEVDALMRSGLAQQGAADLLGKVILAAAFPIDITGRTMQAAPKGVGITKRHRDHVHAELVHLLRLERLAGFNHHGLVVENQAVHRQPDARITQGRRLVV